MSNKSSSLIGKDAETLKFEYNLLKEENLKNTEMSYRVMAFLIPTSIAILTWIAQQEHLSFYQLFSAALVSITGLWIAYKIDRRLTMANKLRRIQMNAIEKHFNLWNHRLFDENQLPANLICKGGKIREKFKSLKSVHEYFKIYIIIFAAAWIILIIMQQE